MNRMLYTLALSFIFCVAARAQTPTTPSILLPNQRCRQLTAKEFCLLFKQRPRRIMRSDLHILPDAGRDTLFQLLLQRVITRKRSPSTTRPHAATNRVIRADRPTIHLLINMPLTTHADPVEFSLNMLGVDSCLLLKGGISARAQSRTNQVCEESLHLLRCLAATMLEPALSDGEE